jgi:peptide/nickel transport system substrate-binding protein
VNCKTILILSLLIPTLLLTGCKKPPEEEKTTQAAYTPKNDPLVNPSSLFEPPPEELSHIANNETLFLQLDGSPNTLNPIFVSSLYEFTVVDTLYTGLFTFDKEMTWRPNEEIVEKYEESANLTEFTVKMKQGYTWHDGKPLTAHDVVYSWKEILDPQVPCPSQKSGTDQIYQCIALDDYTVKFVQKKPMATARWNLSFPIIPRHIFEKHKAEHPDLKTGEYYNQQSRQPIGSGPYKMIEWKENDKIVVERWEDYAGKKPYFKRIVFRIIPDVNVTLLSFEKETVDVIRRLSPQQFAKETNSESFAKVGYKAWGVQWAFAYIGWNMDGSNPFFNDKRVRFAMTHALNIPLILDKIFYNLATPCYGNYHPDSWMYNPQVEHLGFDLEKSKEFLDQAGWKISEEDGWRYKEIDGQKIKFEFTLTLSQGSSTAPKMAAIYQEDLKKLGVEMKTRTLEWATFLQSIRKHEFQAETAMWGTGTDPDMGWNLWRTEEYSKGRNYGGYSNERVDELFVKGRHEFDFEKRKKVYQKIHKIVYGDQPYTWIYNAPILSAFNKRIRGVQFSPRGIYGFDPSFAAWWVSPSEAKYVVNTP